ncbi:MAG TPA: phosphodiester glycosidase family protein [Acetivibrio sp.]|nr:phosphodiester glycosidase family protein [Acetivibrio sp.]
MKYIRKSVSVLIIISLVIMLSLPGVNAGIIYESKTTEVVTSGVTLETITRFADEGWQKINVLRVNLNNPNVKVDTLTNSESIRNLTNVKALAESGGAVAAINASFFSWLSESGKGDPIGPIIQSGKVVYIDEEFNRYNNSMATLAIDNDKNVHYDYWKTSITLNSPYGGSANVSQYNKLSPSDYNDLTIWTPKWSKYSIGATEQYKDMVEMVVVGNTVMEVRKNLPAVEIPQNGYVIMGRGDNGKFLYNKFQAGDEVNLTISTTIDWETIEMAATGGAMLVKDGKIPSTFSHDASGASRRPRTAAGSSKSGKELILVTVDGDQSAVKGMTMKELANLMLDLGAYNAINFDGGGSTTMVSRTPASNNLKVVSNVGGSLRSIATAIGIFSVCPPSSLEGLIIDKEQSNVFINTPVKLSVRGYDTYFNPFAVDQSKIKWSVSGIEGSFEDSTFHPKTSGFGTITASIDGVTSSTGIMVLDKPNRLILSDKELYLTVGSSRTLSVKATDSNGYTSNVNPENITWTLEGDVGKLENNTFTATKTGVGYIKASWGDAQAYCAVSVVEETLHSLDKFEKWNGLFSSAPANLPGSYELSNEQKKSGKYSGKLTYDFSYLEGTRAAYVVFDNDGINLGENTTELNMWVYNPRENSNWLRAEVVDAAGKKHLISFCNGMDWTGWRQVSASLRDIDSPTRLTRVYLAQVNPVPEAGYIYIDDLGFKQHKDFPEIDKDTVPEDVFAPDAANKVTELADDSIRFSVIANTIEKPQNMLQKLMNLRFAEGVNADDTIKDPQIISNIKSYDCFDAGKSRFIVLDTSDKSLRTSSSGQWQWFSEKLESFSGDNLFIFMKNPPSTFSDSLEANLFKKLLVEKKEKTGKNIWVFYNGSTNTYTPENGIRYFSLAQVSTTGLTPENAIDAKYIEVTATGTDVSYQYKSMFE